MRMQDNLYQTNEFLTTHPYLGGLCGIGAGILGYVDVVQAHDIVEPYIMLLKDVGIIAGTIVSVWTLVGLLYKKLIKSVLKIFKK